MAQTFRKWHKIIQICETSGERKIFPSANPAVFRTKRKRVVCDRIPGWGWIDLAIAIMTDSLKKKKIIQRHNVRQVTS